MYLNDYLQDGAGYQARAVLMALQGLCGSEEIRIGRWENCREQGYVISVKNEKFEQLNICWFEHRNSDAICALRWVQSTTNSPTINDIPDASYPDKWHNDKSVRHSEYQDMAEWIKKQIENHKGCADGN